MKRTATTAIAILMGAALVGCNPQPTYCTATLGFGAASYCAAGPQPVPGSSETSEITITATVYPGTAFDAATFALTAHGTFGSRGVTLFNLHASQDAGLNGEGFGIGTHPLVSDEAGDVRAVQVDGETGVHIVESGTLTITEIEIEIDPTSPPAKKVTRLRASFDLNTDRGHVTGSASIG